MSYSERQRQVAMAWKQSTGTLPDGARVPAPYVDKSGQAEGPARDVCLPAEHAALSLLPEVRRQATALFDELAIPWHAAVDGGPSNHLLSSQVQCVNALGQMMGDPGRVERAFGDLLDVAEVLPIEPGRYLTFEYIGPVDFFGEQPGGVRTRGARCTSLDAAFKHRAGDGRVELVLIEWKYTESYRRRRAADPDRDAIRTGRYGRFVADPSGPVRSDVLPFDLLLDEPLYQLVRQQLLAHELERSGAEDADRVRILHVLPPDNEAYLQSLVRPEHRELAATVSELWEMLLRRPERFTSVDPRVFLDPEVTSSEYVARYGPSETR